MRKFWKRILMCLMVAVSFWFGSLIADRQQLQDALIRFHVVANSDSTEDQQIKLQVRDAVIGSLQQELEQIRDVNAAKAYLQENLPKIQTIANETLKRAGVSELAVVSLCRERFGTRDYETFTLPAGVYESLRIIIGEGKGHNWWCVAFPALCLPATSEGFETAAVSSGFSETLSQTLSGGEHEIRFFLLDALGHLENMFFTG